MKIHRVTTVTISLLVSFSSCTKKQEKKADVRAFDIVMVEAKSAAIKRNGGHTVPDGHHLIPDNISTVKLRDLAKKLKLSDWSLDTYGDAGITVIEQAFTGCLYRLSTLEGGSRYLVSLLTDDELSWDAGHLLTLQDAIVKCGDKAIPELRKVEHRRDLADKCIKLIEDGATTAF